MVNAEITDEELVLRVQGADKIWALKSELRIPPRHIAGARVDPEIVHGWHGGKIAGALALAQRSEVGCGQEAKCPGGCDAQDRRMDCERVVERVPVF